MVINFDKNALESQHKNHKLQGFKISALQRIFENKNCKNKNK